MQKKQITVILTQHVPTRMAVLPALVTLVILETVSTAPTLTSASSTCTTVIPMPSVLMILVRSLVPATQASTATVSSAQMKMSVPVRSTFAPNSLPAQMSMAALSALVDQDSVVTVSTVSISMNALLELIAAVKIQFVQTL